MQMIFSVAAAGRSPERRCAPGAAARGQAGAGAPQRALRRAVAAMLTFPTISPASVAAIGDVELGLGHEVDGAQLERLQRHVGAPLGQRRDHHHRHRP